MLNLTYEGLTLRKLPKRKKDTVIVLNKSRHIMDVESGIFKKPALDVITSKVIYLSAPSRKVMWQYVLPSMQIQLQDLVAASIRDILSKLVMRSDKSFHGFRSVENQSSCCPRAFSLGNCL